jgi:internalin A
MPAPAQQISITDPGLDAAIRDTLQKPTGPLTEQDLLNLTDLDASGRGVSNLAGLEGAHHLTVLNLQSNQLANLSFPSGLTDLSVLELSFNPLTNCTFPAGLTNLAELDIEETPLTSLSLPADMTGLITLAVFGNQLTNLTFSADPRQLEFLDVSQNQFTSLTFPPEMSNLSSLFLFGNPLTTLVLPEPLLAVVLADPFENLNDVDVFTYPLAPRLIAPRLPGDGSFQFAVIGPPGVYAIFASTDLAVWNKLATLTNQVGTIRFTDPSPRLAPQKFFRAVLAP